VAIIKKKIKIASAGEGVEKREHLCIVVGNVNYIASMDVPQKLRMELPYYFSYPKEIHTLLFLWGWNLNSGLHIGKAGTLLLEPYLQLLVL
jgi:hypothetical protein